MGRSILFLFCLFIGIVTTSVANSLESPLFKSTYVGTANFAIDYLYPGSPSLQEGTIEDFEDSFLLYREHQDGSREYVGEVGERIITMKDQEQAKAMNIKEYKLDGQTKQEVLMIDLNSLNTYYESEHGSDFSVTHYYEQDRIITESETIDNQYYKTEFNIDAPYFTLGMSEIIVRSIPLFKGYKAFFIGFQTEGKEDFVNVNLHVRGVEKTVTHNDRQFSTWVVEVAMDNQKNVYYLERDTRKLVKVEHYRAGKEPLIKELI